MIKIEYLKFTVLNEKGLETGKNSYGFSVSDGESYYSEDVADRFSELSKYINPENAREVLKEIEGYEDLSDDCEIKFDYSKH